MENLEDTMPNGMPPQGGEAYDPDDDLPASPEEIGLESAAPIADAVQEPVDPPASNAADHSVELRETGSSARTGSAEAAGGAGQPGVPDTPDPPPSPVAAKEPERRRSGWLKVTLLGLLFLTLIAIISAFGGYRSGITLRQEAASTERAAAIRQQYELGVQDMEDGYYYRARQRFEYVIGLDPLYPGAAENLAAVFYELNTTATPTLVPTPTLTPTPDLRGVQELFDQGQEYLRNGEWDSAIETLLSLRKVDPAYLAVQVDGMLFIALRNRGKDKILLEQDLEGGIYDLTLAERFGILDAEADALLSWTQLYITGASFWEINWEQAVSYFSQVAPNLPNLMDKSGYTATERYRVALIEYAYSLAEQKKWCKAYNQLELALSLGYDAQVEQDLKTTASRCEKQEEPNSK